MQIKNLFAFACCALALSVFSAPKPSADEKGGLPYRMNELGHALVTKDLMKDLIAKEIELRRKLAEPRYYMDVQLNLQDVLRQVVTDPFEGHPGRVDESLSQGEQDDAWCLYQVYSAYLKTGGMRNQLVSLLGSYEGHGMFRHVARVERAKDFYKSDKMRKLLQDLKLFNASFRHVDRSVLPAYAEGGKFGHASQRKVTLSELLNGESTYGQYVNESGTPRSDFWNRLTVLMRYNARMCDDELKKMKEAAAVSTALLERFANARKMAAEGARKCQSREGVYRAIAPIVELDEKIADCITLALLGFDATVKKFEDTGTDEFQLRSGLPCADVFARVDVATDRREGPDYHKLVLKSYFHLKDAFDKLSRQRNGQPIPIR